MGLVAKRCMPPRVLPARQHTHHGLADAIEQAELFANLFTWPAARSRGLGRAVESVCIAHQHGVAASKGGRMRASVNDRLVVRGHHVGDPDREAVILEVHGEDGAPPYLVRWTDGHQSLFFPASDTGVEHHPSEPRAT